MMAGELEVDLSRRALVIERIRAGGYGLGGAHSDANRNWHVGGGGQAARRSQWKESSRRTCAPCRLRAASVPYLGKYESYALTARNFNPVMAFRWKNRHRQRR